MFRCGVVEEDHAPLEDNSARDTTMPKDYIMFAMPNRDILPCQSQTN